MLSDMSEVLYKLRNESGLTQEEVAAAVGISRATYTRFENGTTRKPDAVTVIRLAHLYHVTPEYIMMMNDEEDESCAREDELIAGLRRLNNEGVERLMEQLDYLLSNPRYRQETHTASGM